MIWEGYDKYSIMSVRNEPSMERETGGGMEGGRERHMEKEREREREREREYVDEATEGQ